MFEGQTALITGPTEGIGRDLAFEFAKEGCDLVLVSRRLTKLKQLQTELEEKFGINTRAYSMDLSLNGSADQLISIIRAEKIEVNILVNNAGFGVYGSFTNSDLGAQIGMVELHITTPMRLAHAFLPLMIKQKKGGILNVGSTGGFQPVPIQNVYCATKSFTLHFTEALAEELLETGVKVTCLCPGPTDTPFFDTQFMKSRGPSKHVRMPSSLVAKVGVEAFKKGKVLMIPGWSNRALALSVRLAPRAAVRKAAKKAVERPPDNVRKPHSSPSDRK